jgi:hypothetical protein
MPDLGSGAARRVGSSPIIRTKSFSSREAFLFLPLCCFLIFVTIILFFLLV